MSQLRIIEASDLNFLKLKRTAGFIGTIEDLRVFRLEMIKQQEVFETMGDTEDRRLYLSLKSSIVSSIKQSFKNPSIITYLACDCSFVVQS